MMTRLSLRQAPKSRLHRLRVLGKLLLGGLLLILFTQSGAFAQSEPPPTDINDWYLYSPQLVSYTVTGGGTCAASLTPDLQQAYVTATGDGTSNTTTIIAEYTQVIEVSTTDPDAPSSKGFYVRANYGGTGGSTDTGASILLGYYIPEIPYDNSYGTTCTCNVTGTSDGNEDIASILLYQSVGYFTVHYRVEAQVTGYETMTITANMKGYIAPP